MGIKYAKFQTSYSGLYEVITYNDSITIDTYDYMRFTIKKNHENIENISKIISQYKDTGRILKFTYDSIIYSNVLTDISVPNDSEQNMKFIKKIDYVINKKFNEFVFDSPGIFIIMKKMSNDLIPGSMYKITYRRYTSFNFITSFIQVGLGNEIVDIAEHSTEFKL